MNCIAWGRPSKEPSVAGVCKGMWDLEVNLPPLVHTSRAQDSPPKQTPQEGGVTVTEHHFASHQAKEKSVGDIRASLVPNEDAEVRLTFTCMYYQRRCTCYYKVRLLS